MSWFQIFKQSWPLLSQAQITISLPALFFSIKGDGEDCSEDGSEDSGEDGGEDGVEDGSEDGEKDSGEDSTYKPVPTHTNQ